jgi:hypothetical protein
MMEKGPERAHKRISHKTGRSSISEPAEIFLILDILRIGSMADDGSPWRDSMASKEAELRQRNEEVDRRRAEALRLAGDVVRHQEVPHLCASVLRVHCPVRGPTHRGAGRQDKLMQSPSALRSSSARSERASAENSPAKSAISAQGVSPSSVRSRPASAHSRYACRIRCCRRVCSVLACDGCNGLSCECSGVDDARAAERRFLDEDLTQHSEEASQDNADTRGPRRALKVDDS